MSVLIPEVIERPTSSTKAVRDKALDELMKAIAGWFGKDWAHQDES